MNKHRLFACATALAGLPVVMATPAHALPLAAIELPAIAVAALSNVPTCDTSLGPRFGAPAPFSGLAQTGSKASAILGGQASQLDLIRQQQAGGAAPTMASATPRAVPGTGLAPAAAPVTCAAPVQRLGLPAMVQQSDGQGLAMPTNPALRFQPGIGLPGVSNPEDFLASKRLPVRRTTFDASWNRVSHAGLSRHQAAALVGGLSGAPTLAMLSAVNTWSNTRIRYEDDSHLYGRADYWASAGTTLSRGAGDCEDIAILKMQVLAALGVPRADMYLTIARDLTRRADHALLVVKLDRTYWLLDNATNRPLDASQSYDYQPILSFSGGQKWLHGY